MIDVAKMFAENANIPTKSREALYLLAAPSTPEAVRIEAVERAQTGEVITHKGAQAMIANGKPGIDGQVAKKHSPKRNTHDPTTRTSQVVTGLDVRP